RKAALRRKRELLERRVASGFFDPALEIVLTLELAQLRCDQPQHDRLAFRQEAKRSKIAAALIVVLEEIGIDVHLRQQRLRDGLVTALRRPCALEVAAAQMH